MRKSEKVIYLITLFVSTVMFNLGFIA